METGQFIDRFIDKKNHFLVTPKGRFYEIKLKANQLLDKLDDHKKQVEAYAAKNHLDFGKEEELARILSFYDSLLDD